MNLTTEKDYYSALEELECLRLQIREPIERYNALLLRVRIYEGEFTGGRVRKEPLTSLETVLVKARHDKAPID